jgi:hypothetical protein
MPPSFLDGARVLFRATGDFGVTGEGTPIVALVIARYDDDRQDAVYSFACDSQWNVVGDLLHSSIEEAQREAELYYEMPAIRWDKA